MVKIMSNIYLLQREEDKDGKSVYFHSVGPGGSKRRCFKRDMALSFESVLMASHYKSSKNLNNYSIVKYEENSS